MRKLTEEEREFMPVWATHYWIPSSPNKVMFESQSYFQLLSDGELSTKYDNAAGRITGSAVELVKETFGIYKHEIVEYGYVGVNKDGNIYVKKSGFNIDKDRCIAIAKHLGLTVEDLTK